MGKTGSDHKPGINHKPFPSLDCGSDVTVELSSQEYKKCFHLEHIATTPIPASH